MDYRATFDGVAETYDAVRPAYPEKLIAEIVSLAGLGADSSLLEVGTGTGQITRPFAERGFELVGLELGQNLAKFTREKFADAPNVDILNTSFEDYKPARRFDLLLSAQAFHWIEPEFGVRKTAELLKPGGKVALVWQLDRSSDTAFYKATTPCFETYVSASEQPDRPSPAGGFEIYRQALHNSSLFFEPHTWSLRGQTIYSKEDYLKLLNTFSNVIALESKTRTEFLAEIAEVIDDFDSSVTRHYETVLLFAKKAPRADWQAALETAVAQNKLTQDADWLDADLDTNLPD